MVKFALDIDVLFAMRGHDNVAIFLKAKLV